MERREFIQACTVLLASSALVAGCGSGSDDSTETGASNGSSLPNLSRNSWTGIASTQFSVSHPSYGVIDMQLTSIDNELAIPEADQFSVVLTGPELPLLEEDVYQLYNDSLGYIDLLLQPGESPPGAQNYRALFSLI